MAGTLQVDFDYGATGSVSYLDLAGGYSMTITAVIDPDQSVQADVPFTLTDPCVVADKIFFIDSSSFQSVYTYGIGSDTPVTIAWTFEENVFDENGGACGDIVFSYSTLSGDDTGLIEVNSMELSYSTNDESLKDQSLLI